MASAHPSDRMGLDERLETHLEFLTSGFCHGREVGTSGAIRSALYVIDEFKSVGLTPAFQDGYVQSYVIPEMTCDNNAAVEVLDGQEKVAKAYVHLKDFAESYMPRRGKTVFQAPLALAPASDAGWADVKRGSVVLVKSETNDTNALTIQIARTRGIAVLRSVPATAA